MLYVSIMSERPAMHVVTTVRRSKGKIYRAHLLRRSFREQGKVKKETLANLTPLGDSIVDLIRQSLKGGTLMSVDDAFRITGSRHHGHARAVTVAMKRLGIDKLLGSKPSRERQVVLALIGARILDPRSKLATATCLGNSTLPELLDVGTVSENEMYDAMDWLLARQPRIENALAKPSLARGWHGAVRLDVELL